MDQSKHLFKSRSNSLANLFLVLSAAWILVVSTLLAVDIFQIRRTQQDMARNDALANFNKDQAFRWWAASHGGVYVPVTERTPPNPCLSDVAERDVRTPTGKSLTLMNPAYMVRQMMEDYAALYGIRGHITSLKPCRPETSPDDWERAALVKFEDGAQEVADFTQLNGQPQVRLMRPLYVQDDCLRCHAKQGYRLGDVRGGTSISVPMAPYLASMRRETTVHVASFGLLLLLGLAVLAVARRLLMREMRERDQAELELQRARDALTEQTAQLTKANQLLTQSNEALRDFASVASHDLQEPLRKIQAFADRLTSKYADCFNGETSDYLYRMQNAAMRMQSLIRSLLSYSRLQTNGEHLEAVDLTALIQEVVADLEIRLQETGGQVDIGDLPTVRADRSQMCQLFQNLIDNALKYRRGGEKPVVRVSAQSRQDGFHEIHIEDNGIGFDEQHLGTIFRPFQRLHGRDEYQGTGIGLAICRKIAERHGGTITARSVVDQGSDFIVTLPAAGTS